MIFAALHAATGQSVRPGWGATPYAGPGGTGVTFRVWAPHATSIGVPGVFNGWNTGANLLVREGTTDVWSLDVPAARTNHEYKFYLNGSLWKSDPRSAEIRSGTRNSVVHNRQAFPWSGDSFSNPPLKDLVVYEMHAGTFHDPTPGNGINATLVDAIAKLDHVKDLGATAVELMPVNDYPTATSWGYNPAYPFSVENAYGGPAALQQFVKACHDRDLAVFIDIVHNHYGPDTDLWQFDGWTPNPSYGGIYFFNTNYLCCTPWGVTRPNYDEPQVRDFIRDTFHMWIEDYHIDGFRWDTPFHMIFAETNGGQYAFIPSGFSLIEECLQMVATQYPGRVNIAENAKYFESFDSYWETGFPWDLAGVLTQGVDANRNMFTIASLINGSGDGLKRVLFSESHDTVGNLNGGIRLPTAIDGATPTSYAARKRSMLGAAVAFASPGIPMVFQGQEMLENQSFGDTLPVDWTKTNTHSRVTSFYRDLIRLRRNLDGVSGGLQGAGRSVTRTDNSFKIIVAHRWDAEQPDQDVVVVFNFANQQRNNMSIPFPSAGTWYVHLDSDSESYGADFTNAGSTVVSAVGSSSASGPITIAPYSVMVLSKLPRSASLEAATAIDAPGGNADGFVDPGEKILEELVVRNRNGGAVSNVTVTLLSTNPLIRILYTNSPLPTLQGGALGTNVDVVGYHVSRTATCGSVFHLHAVVEQPGFAVTSVIERRVGRPVITGSSTGDCDSADVPVNILDLTTVQSSLSITAPGSPTIEDVDAMLRIDHTWNGDIEITLRHPDGTTATLSSHRGSSSDNYGSNACPSAIRTVFDDEAATAISAGTAPYLGSFHPETALSAFDGKPVTGTWTLSISDNFGADTGTLLCWGLRIVTSESTFDCVVTNQPPSALPVFASAETAVATNIVLAGEDLDDDPISFHVVSAPSNGFLVATSPPVYESVRNFTGTDTWNFVVSDGLSTSAPGPAHVVVFQPLDTDGDGISDAWELEHFGDPANGFADADDDGDLQSNLSEFQSGTSPTNGAEFLYAQEGHVDEFTGAITIRWPSVGHTRYRIEYSRTVEGAFTPIPRPFADEVDPNPIGTPGTMTFVDDFTFTPPPATDESLIYRIRVVGQ